MEKSNLFAYLLKKDSTMEMLVPLNHKSTISHTNTKQTKSYEIKYDLLSLILFLLVLKPALSLYERGRSSSVKHRFSCFTLLEFPSFATVSHSFFSQGGLGRLNPSIWMSLNPFRTKFVRGTYYLGLNI